MPFLRIVTLQKITSNCGRSNTVLNRTITENNFSRHLTMDATKFSQSTLKKEKEKLRTYFAQRYVQYVKKYASAFDNKFPVAMKMYRVFSIGLKDFYKDLKTYISLRLRVAKDRGFNNISRQELELYQKMPRDMWKIAPVLIFSIIPFGNYIIFPLAFLSPRRFLCSHFWSIQQKAEFTILDLKERLRHNRPVFRALQAKLDKIEDKDLRIKWTRVIALIGSGLHPSAKEVVICKELFTREPYNLDYISYGHSGHLLNMLGLRKGLLRTSRLKYQAFLLHEIDKAIMREGGAASMNTESLRHACHVRGLNSSHLSNKDMISWLNQWLYVSTIIGKDSYSLLLHCPIIFAYNHPQNWMLIY